MMKAMVFDGYGEPDEVLEMRNVPVPSIGDDDVRIEVRAAAVNPLDWHMLVGKPFVARVTMGMIKPKRSIPGNDIAGVVEAVGKNVTELQPGDEVFGESPAGGGLAEFLAIESKRVVHKPAGTTFEAAASVGVAGFTALQGLRDWGEMEPGDEVLIVGASGGVGTYAVQIAKNLGASHVTGVCSTRNVDTARSLGADLVIDYQKEDFVETGRQYDLIFDVPGNRRLSDLRLLLKPGGKYVQIGGAKGDWFGPIPRIIRMGLASLVGYMKSGFGVATASREDLVLLRDWLESGQLRTIIDRNYKLDEAADALTYQGTFHAQGKIVITI